MAPLLALCAAPHVAPAQGPTRPPQSASVVPDVFGRTVNHPINPAADDAGWCDESGAKRKKGAAHPIARRRAASSRKPTHPVTPSRVPARAPMVHRAPSTTAAHAAHPAQLHGGVQHASSHHRIVAPHTATSAVGGSCRARPHPAAVASSEGDPAVAHPASADVGTVASAQAEPAGGVTGVAPGDLALAAPAGPGASLGKLAVGAAGVGAAAVVASWWHAPGQAEAPGLLAYHGGVPHPETPNYPGLGIGDAGSGAGAGTPNAGVPDGDPPNGETPNAGAPDPAAPNGSGPAAPPTLPGGAPAGGPPTQPGAPGEGRPPVSTVPEPAPLALVAAGALVTAAAARRRRR